MTGHQKIIKVLEKELARGNLAQAYFFCGPESVGKKLAAFWLAGKILGKEKAENHPDFIFLEPESLEKKGVIKKGDIKIEKIREMQQQLGLTSVEGKGKVAVIDDADKMTVSAQNSLLKTLEEPNEKITIILVANDEKKILPTILSRCRRIKFSLVSDEEIKKMIPEKAKDGGMIAFWSFGRPGLAQKMISDEMELEKAKESFREFKELFSDSAGEKFALAEKLGNDVPSAIDKLKIWSAILRLPLLNKSDKIKISPKKSLHLLEEIEKSLERLGSSNANAKLILENLFLNF